MTEPSELSRRQPFRRSATSNRSSSTVNSYEIQAASDYGAADDELSYGNTINQSFQLNSCTDTVLGDRVTNIYNNFLARDSNNPAFILSDTNVGLDKKIKFTLTRRWFWIYVLLIVMMVTAFLVIGQVLSFVAIRSIAVETDWGKREPEPGLIPLRLPVVQVIVVDTADEDECCPTREECVRRLRAMQVFYRNYLKDVPFNFMIGCDGMVYAGRGFHFQGEIFAPPTNISESLIKSESMARITDLSRIMAYDKLVGIDELSQADENIFVLAFIGNFSEQPPSLEMLQTFTDFLSRSAGQDMLAEDYTFVTQKQLESPENSDDALTVALRQLPHFQESETYFNITLRDEWLSNMTLLSRIERSTRTDFGVTTIHLAMINYGCSDLLWCSNVLEEILDTDLNEGLQDMQHNFYITKAGIFEGRGFFSPGHVSSFSIAFFDCSRDQFKYDAMKSVLRNATRFGVVAPFETLNFENKGCPVVTDAPT